MRGAHSLSLLSELVKLPERAPDVSHAGVHTSQGMAGIELEKLSWARIAKSPQL